MVAAIGLVGLRPAAADVGRVVSPPYDVIKSGTPLWSKLDSEPASIFHVILGDTPQQALNRLQRDGHLFMDSEPAFYVLEQRSSAATRWGVFLAPEVSAYSEKKVIRH